MNHRRRTALVQGRANQCRGKRHAHGRLLPVSSIKHARLSASSTGEVSRMLKFESNAAALLPDVTALTAVLSTNTSGVR